MRCLYCGKQLALFKKLTGGGEFCSDAHKLAYHEEYNKLALSRLMEAQSREDKAAAEQPAPASPPPALAQPEIAEPAALGEYFSQTPQAKRPISGPEAAASLEVKPLDREVVLPVVEGLSFAPAPEPSGLIMEHRPVNCDVGVAVPDTEFLRTVPESLPAVPELSLNIAKTGIPATAGPVAFEPQPAWEPGAELAAEPSVRFEFEWDLPEGLDLDWIPGIGEMPAEPTSDQAGAGDEEEAELIIPVGTLPAIISPETPEPVIDDALLVSLFGREEKKEPKQDAPNAEAAPEPGPEPAIAQTIEPVGEPELVVAQATEPVAEPEMTTAPAPEPTAEPEPATAQSTEPAVKPEAAAPATTEVPREPGSFLPMTIRPAGPPSKTRLMQTFQAISLVGSHPQIPVWNLVPLRPKMGIARSQNSGSRLPDRAKTDLPTAKQSSGTAVQVADASESTPDLDVPTFGVTNRPRGGLARWFKLGIAIGVLGIASGTLEQKNGCAAATHQNMTTEFAVCRN